MRVVVDWDATVTEADVLEETIRAFGDERVYEETEGLLGPLTLNDVIAIEVGTVKVPLARVVDWVVATARVRPGFVAFARKRKPLVVSSGFHELIEPVLEREGLELEVRANRLDARADGWRALFRSDYACTACGEPCKRADVAGLGDFAFAGDGVSDECLALAAARIFARDRLASYLARKGVSFEHFDDFHDVELALAGRPLEPPRRREPNA